jgi:hypothetical protein
MEEMEALRQELFVTHTLVEMLLRVLVIEGVISKTNIVAITEASLTVLEMMENEGTGDRAKAARELLERTARMLRGLFPSAPAEQPPDQL